MNRIAIKIAASAAALSLAPMAFSTSAALARPEGAAKAANEAVQFHTQAQRAVQEGQLVEALTLMEQAVERSPRDAGYRLTLADLYLKNGRFEAARATYADVLDLDPGHVRAGLSYSLTQIALGRPQAAVAQLDQLHGRASAADVGLAYALAGMPERAIEILEPAARQHDATPRVRQNLALSYALAGSWSRARAVAAQDISAAELPRRLQQWAAMARPGGQTTQVASLLGVNPVADPGQPVRLALAQPQPAVEAPAEAFAEAAPVAAEVTYAAASPAESVSDPAWWPSENAEPVEVAEAAAPEVPEVRFAQNIPEEEAEVRFAAAAETLVEASPAVVRSAAVSRPPAPVFRPETPRAVTAPNGRFVVQLGAFSNEGNAERAWQQVSSRHGLAQHQPTTTTIDLNGRTLHRVSLSGFATPREAGRLCGSIKAQGGVCFVRMNAGDAVVRWAARYAPGRTRDA
jgi:Flp pilus assembly protein TadD